MTETPNSSDHQTWSDPTGPSEPTPAPPSAPAPPPPPPPSAPAPPPPPPGSPELTQPISADVTSVFATPSAPTDAPAPVDPWATPPAPPLPPPYWQAGPAATPYWQPAPGATPDGQGQPGYPAAPSPGPAGYPYNAPAPAAQWPPVMPGGPAAAGYPPYQPQWTQSAPSNGPIVLLVVSAVLFVFTAGVIGLPSGIMGIVATTRRRDNPLGAASLTKKGWIVFAANFVVVLVVVIGFLVAVFSQVDLSSTTSGY